MIPIIEATTQKDVVNAILKRTQFDFTDVNDSVEAIVNDVKTNKDSAVRRYTKRFDKASIKTFKIEQATIDGAFERVSDTLVNDLKRAAANIREFHQKQAPTDTTLKDRDGVVLKEKVRPIERVGIYVPGGSAAYPSTVLMNAIPAVIAGVKRIVMVTPPSADGTIKDALLVAASIAGVDEIYTVGGAQAVAALAFGTQSIPKVDKIVGPGNIYVTVAKRIVSGYVGIDIVAGPSEIVVLADETTNPQYAAADMLSQAEHDPYASSIVLSTSSSVAARIKEAAIEQTKSLSRRGIIQQSLEKNSAIIVCDSISQQLELSNAIAPEHLEVLTKDADSIAEQVINAGAIFIGAYTPEPVGDYFAGPNHTLPTSGSARFSSALSTRDFIKITAITKYSKAALEEAGEAIINIANEEGLTAHANAVRLRLEES